MSISSITSSSLSATSSGTPPKKPDASDIIAKDDQNSNGKLDSVEISDLAKHLSEMTGEDVDAESLISTYDKDGDGELNSDELDSLMADFKPSGPPPQGAGGPGGAGGSSEESEEEYDDLDTNKDGVVSYTERLAGQTDLTEVALAAITGIESEE